MQQTIPFATSRGEGWLPPGCERIALPDAELLYMPSFYTTRESTILQHKLLEETPWRHDTLRFAGRPVLVPRLQAWYGDVSADYGYSGLRLSRLPWTPVLTDIRQRIEGTLDLKFNSVLLNYYRDGQDSVAWHSDDERELGPDPWIASLSLGIPRSFELKHRSPQHPGKRRITLADGSLLLMGAGLQQHWMHQLPKAPAITSPRLNLTFRFIH